MKFVKMFLALVGLAALFVFVRDNTGKIVVKFWDYATPEIELFLVLIITFALGMIAASFGSTLKIFQLKRQLKNAGSGATKPGGENKKEKKEKDKKKDSKKKDSDSGSTSAGSYTAAGAAGSAYANSSTTQPTQEDTQPGVTQASLNAQADDQEDTLLADAALDENKSSTTSQVLEEEEIKKGSASVDDVISLPADNISSEEEDKK
jgi:uncharacterized integral membrane protein